MTLERLWAGWRMSYVGQAGDGLDVEVGEEPGPDTCVFCRILASGEPDESTYVVWRGQASVALLNAYPYASGHVLVIPHRHVGRLGGLSPVEATELWTTATEAVQALEVAYGPEGVNLGINMGRAAGAGVPGHIHAHVLPRWNGDTNFMTSVAEARVLPEALPVTWKRLREAWPASMARTALG